MTLHEPRWPCPTMMTLDDGFWTPCDLYTTSKPGIICITRKPSVPPFNRIKFEHDTNLADHKEARVESGMKFIVTNSYSSSSGPLAWLGLVFLLVITTLYRTLFSCQNSLKRRKVHITILALFPSSSSPGGGICENQASAGLGDVLLGEVQASQEDCHKKKQTKN